MSYIGQIFKMLYVCVSKSINYHQHRAYLHCSRFSGGSKCVELSEDSYLDSYYIVSLNLL